MLTLVGSLLLKVTVRPVLGAGKESEMGNGTDWPVPTDTLDGKIIAPKTLTVTFSVALLMFVVLALAVIVAEPFLTPVTGTETVVAPAGILTLAGTVATAVLLELKLIARADGAAIDSFSVKFVVPPTPIDAVGDEKLSDAPTLTVLVAPW